MIDLFFTYEFQGLTLINFKFNLKKLGQHAVQLIQITLDNLFFGYSHTIIVLVTFK